LLKSTVVEQEARKVPILNDILDNKVLGREYKRGHQDGVQEGIEQGIEQGREQSLEQGVQQGELTIVRRLIEAPLRTPAALGGAEPR
jgi:flagellar biosynthesis/type III secretory pathway protein FliH